MLDSGATASFDGWFPNLETVGVTGGSCTSAHIIFTSMQGVQGFGATGFQKLARVAGKITVQRMNALGSIGFPALERCEPFLAPPVGRHFTPSFVRSVRKPAGDRGGLVASSADPCLVRGAAPHTYSKSSVYAFNVHSIPTLALCQTRIEELLAMTNDPTETSQIRAGTINDC